MAFGDSALISVALALGIGLLIGVERERRKGRGPKRAFAGVRTFALVGLVGAAVQLLGQLWLTAIAAGLVAALAMVSYLRDRSNDPGVTTEIALFLTFVLGVLALPYPAIAAGAGVVVAGLLAARGPLQQFVTRTLSEEELRNALVLAGAALVILPLTPDRPMDALAGVNPQRVWQLVVMILCVQAVGDIALRVFGARLGLALGGLVAGFVSSTATVATMGERAARHAQLRPACLAGAWLSTVSTIVLLLLITALTHPLGLGRVIPMLGASLVLALLIGLLAFRRSPLPAEESSSHGRAFSLTRAIALALLFTGIATLVAWAQQALGTEATLLTTALAGVADAHSSAAAVLGLAARGAIDAGAMALGVLLAFSTNTVGKIVAAFVAGGPRYGSEVSAGLLLITSAAWGVWAWPSLR